MSNVDPAWQITGVPNDVPPEQLQLVEHVAGYVPGVAGANVSDDILQLLRQPSTPANVCSKREQQAIRNTKRRAAKAHSDAPALLSTDVLLHTAKHRDDVG